jgi:hypothetical protein
MPMLWSERPNTKIAPENYDAVRISGMAGSSPAMTIPIVFYRVQVGWTHWNEPMCFVHSGARFG